MVNIQRLLEYIEENRPRAVRIPYRYILLPLFAFIVLTIMLAVIRDPQGVTPAPGSTISRYQVFRFSVVKNALYKGVKVKLKYPADGKEVKTTVAEEGNTIKVTPREILRLNESVQLQITIQKGKGFITFWDKTFTYSYTTGT